MSVLRGEWEKAIKPISKQTNTLISHKNHITPEWRWQFKLQQKYQTVQQSYLTKTASHPICCGKEKKVKPGASWWQLICISSGGLYCFSVLFVVRWRTQLMASGNPTFLVGQPSLNECNKLYLPLKKSTDVVLFAIVRWKQSTWAGWYGTAFLAVMTVLSCVSMTFQWTSATRQDHRKQVHFNKRQFALLGRL